ncbi:MAG: ABC transporter ATP-binding protein [Thaumarchaeota archaeon]|nr:ABC transporter ATP-binding protein [Nitrososphaerota archaeon]
MADLRVENLKAHFFTTSGTVKAVDGVSFSLNGKSLGIAGESGSGKSTLGLALMKLLPSPGKIVSGSVYLEGTNILDVKEEEFRSEIRWKRISMVFQGAMNAMNPVYTVAYQLIEPLKYHSEITKEEAWMKAEVALREVGLDVSIMNRYPHELSGGMKQRVVIAMALILRPQIVIADEPTTALDVIVQAQVINLLKRLKKELGLSIIMITHDLSVISELADIVGIMYAGELVEIGPAEQIYGDPKHPYTQKLLNAVPRLHGKHTKLESIPGAPPDLKSPPPGCRFHPRCPYVMDVCRIEDPPYFDFKNEQRAKCWLYKEKA